MSGVYTVRLLCQRCGRWNTWEVAIPLLPDEKLVFEHPCSETHPGPYRARRERS